jgi:Fusaric acid resistance protein-like
MSPRPSFFRSRRFLRGLARAKKELRRLRPSLLAATAVAGCLVAGQLAGRTAVGLVMALGARRVAIVDSAGQPPGLRAAHMAIAVVAGALAGFAGTLAGHSLALSTLGMFVLGWVAGVARSRSDEAGKLASSPAILFALAQILPGGLDLAAGRALAVAVGGTVAGALVLGIYPTGWLSLVRQRTRVGVRFLWGAMFLREGSARFGLVLAATTSLCLFVVRELDIPRGYWVVVSVLVVLRPEQAVTRRRGRQRLTGTLLGCVLAIGLVFLVRTPAAADVLIFLLMVGFFRLQLTAYGWSLAFFTPAVVLGIGLLEPGNWHWAANRAADVAAGTLVALGVGLLVGTRPTLPPRTVV